MADLPADFNPAEFPAFPPTDESGDVDITLIDDALAKSVAERFEQHYAARLFAEKLRRAGEKFYGSPAADPETLERL